VQVDPKRLTALVLLGLKDRDTFPLLFYRENCADMAMDAVQIDERTSSPQCRALLITGTHLSHPPYGAASPRRWTYAGRHQRDARARHRLPPGAVGPDQTRRRCQPLCRRRCGRHRQLQRMLPHFDLLIGTEEEFLIAGGVAGDLLASLRAVRAVTPAALVVKLGAAGCCFIPGPIPQRTVRRRDRTG
jgi:5-dehydro-2-deoxygluconokinase